MREILFKGKHKDNGEWIENHTVVELRDGQKYIPNNSAPSGLKIDESGNKVSFIALFHEVIPETVGQFTGLTDKNGKKIFEGDIFKFPDEVWESCYTSCGTEYDSWEVENYGVVGFDEYSAKYDFVKYKYNENSVEADLHENGTLDFVEFLTGLEIIGNIHDNPEMMEGGAE